MMASILFDFSGLAEAILAFLNALFGGLSSLFQGLAQVFGTVLVT